ncbi:T9SS type A sorting domain-containing protein [Flavobacterium sp. SM15]|uniref:M1 family aminopeptidase n=1 Tax=Flavobacterium sp. SM15 TaxID=2908005 RepID=UPI001EDC169B|nr:M1 family aminopeptidase [Flavobacterium sp. SM15]MCG2612234.1 T9SS type A sorting domain-containing protein [Flavobacterium sp. SM15]
MKKLALLFALSLSISCFSQDHEDEHHKMVEAEMKSASSLMNFKVNANTQNYDIKYHKLEFTVNPSSTNISGKVTTTFTALSNMSTVTFDLYKRSTSPFTITSVKKDGVNLTFSHNSTHELAITLPSVLATGNSATVEITYNGGVYSPDQAFVVASHNGTPILWTLSEPFGARDWWPCKQDLNDKVDNGFDIYITAPSQYTSVSNGIEPEAPVVVGANKTTHFRHSYPIAAYLIAMAVTNYQTYNQQAGLGTPESPFFPIINYLYPESNTASTQAALDVTPDIINLYESIYGKYAFRNEKYGHAQFGWGGGMEHTTVSFMVGWSRSLIAHELGHHWFGDNVTCGSWKDIWLNEGLTEYMAGVVVENFDGNDSFTIWKDSKINSITSQPGGNLYLTDTQATNINTIFSSRITYNKGSMVAHMLRFKLGDEYFFQGLNNYLNDPALRYGYAVTPQLQNHLENASGMDLDEFFNDWVYMQGYPSYSITAANFGAGQAKITINQTTSHSSVPFFEMPLPIRLLGAGGQTHDVVVNNTVNGEEFVVSVPFTVTGVQFDPNKDIVSNSNTATLGSSEFDLDQNVVLYPNPSKDRLNIQLPSNIQFEKAEIYNPLGQLVATKTINNFQISELASGTHIIKITTSEGVIHKNFIKK